MAQEQLDGAVNLAGLNLFAGLEPPNEGAQNLSFEPGRHECPSSTTTPGSF